MYLTIGNDKYWAIDIEGNDLYPAVSRIWCAVVHNLATKETVRLVGHNQIKEWFKNQPKDIKLIGHNILGYDMPALNKVLETNITVKQCIDTMLMSMFYNPSMDGGHSLGAWGKRLGFRKTEFNDFSKYVPEMLDYCENDTLLCARVYRQLVARMLKEGFTERGIELEHKSWYLTKQQQLYGFPFNFQECLALYAGINEQLDDIKKEIYTFWPPSLEIVKQFKQARKKDGSYTKGFLEHQKQYVRVQEDNNGGYYAYDYVEFNLASGDQRREKLLALGWKPREFTKPSKTHPNGQAKVTDKGELVPSLVEYVKESGKKEVELIAKWLDYNSRATMLNTWMDNYNDKTGRIHGNLWLANTLRYRHSNPNTANIPAVRLSKDGRPLRGEEGAYTYEARDLWTCSDPVNRSLVGVDAKGIQLRVLAHHLNNPEFMEAVVNGDPHTYNQKIGGIRDRPTAKTFIYAFLLGAGDAKIGEIVGGTAQDGRKLKRRFIGNFPGLERLLIDLERQVERTGRIVLCDGTPILVRQNHTRLGYLLQGDENRIMKQAAVYIRQMCVRDKLDSFKVGDIHDEHQYDTLNEHVDPLRSNVLPRAFRAAGERFAYRLPIDCDSKVGKTWAETH